MIRLLVKTYHNADRKIAVSMMTSVQLQKMGIRIDTIIPDGVDPSVYYPGKERRSDPPSVLAYYWPGEPRKGAHHLLDVLQTIRRRHPELRITLLTSPRVSVEGFESVHSLREQALADLYRAYDVFVFPSTYEGFGLPPLEAMACGCAVVATKVGAVTEYARHGFSAWLCDPGKPDQLEEGIERVIESPALRARLSANAVVDSSKWTWKEAGAKLNAYLEGLFLPQGRPGMTDIAK